MHIVYMTYDVDFFNAYVLYEFESQNLMTSLNTDIEWVNDRKEEAKANVLQNYKQFRQWYEKECEKYKKALGGDESFDKWYEEYTGGTWEENNE